MIMEERLTRLQAKLEADPSLGEKLFGLETAEEVHGFLCELELEFSIEEINMMRDVLVKILEKSNDGELSDEDLEEVAGGSLLIAAVGVLCLFLCGFCVGSIATQAGLRW
jgi:predicted ribosomally synthesized peptide with nif11-like leader